MPYKDLEVRRSKAREYSHKWKDAHPEWQQGYNAARRERYANDPEYQQQIKTIKTPRHVRAAHGRVAKALKSGELVRPDTCEECGQKRFAEAAHINYTERFAIRWLCRSCHRAWDAMVPKSEAAPTEPYVPRRPLKISQEIADEMRVAYAAGESQVSLGKRFGVSRALVGNVVRNQAWT